MPDPEDSSFLFPGLSQREVAANMKISLATEKRLERQALLKCRHEFEKRGLSYSAILSLLKSQPNNTEQ